MSRNRRKRIETSPVTVRDLTQDEVTMVICAIDDRASLLRVQGQPDRAGQYEALRKVVTCSPFLLVAGDRR